jgi:hypothetical protein
MDCNLHVPRSFPFPKSHDSVTIATQVAIKEEQKLINMLLGCGKFGVKVRAHYV